MLRDICHFFRGWIVGAPTTQFVEKLSYKIQTTVTTINDLKYFLNGP
jgi:hypothetical protein